MKFQTEDALIRQYESYILIANTLLDGAVPTDAENTPSGTVYVADDMYHDVQMVLTDTWVPEDSLYDANDQKPYRCGEDAYYIDLNDLNLDLSRVSYNRNMGTYDADTGRINFTFANSSRLKGQSFAYIYDTKAPGVKYKNLEVKMTIAEIVDVRDPNAATEETTTEETTTEAPTTTETTTEAPATTETATTGTTVTEATTTQETLVEAPTTTQNVAGNQVQGPKTGDKAPVYTLFIVSCMSLAAAAALYNVRKRR